MARWFNIGGPCNPAQNYMLPAMGRLPDVSSLLRKGQYFVVHAQRQCGKTTAFLSLANETNAKGNALAVYCSLETVQEFPKAEDGIPKVCACLRWAARNTPALRAFAEHDWPILSMQRDEVVVSGVQIVLSRCAEVAGKPLYLFLDEVDCLGGETLISLLRQLRNGKIDTGTGVPFPASIALIGMRDIRDYKANIRPDSKTMGSASPFNVVTEAMTIRTFSDAEVAALYAQHTAETGQVFEPEAIRRSRHSGARMRARTPCRSSTARRTHTSSYRPSSSASSMEGGRSFARWRSARSDSISVSTFAAGSTQWR